MVNDEIFIYSSVAKSFDSGVSLPGLATTSAEANALYAGWAPVLSYGLRRNLDANRPDRTNIIIGNAAGPISDPALSGLTLEMEACVSKPRHGMKVNCTDASLAQAAVTPIAVHLGVFWLTHSEAMPAKEQCERVAAMQKILPWMRQGTDFFDRSHIVCNGTEVLAAAA